MGNCPPFHTEVAPLVTVFRYLLSLGACWSLSTLNPNTLARSKEVLERSQNPQPKQRLRESGKETFGYLVLDLGTTFLDGRCPVHHQFLEVWAFFLHVNRMKTSVTKGKRSQASEMNSKIFMPCWLEHIWNFFHQMLD